MSPDNIPLVSIVIPIYNEEAILERALNELLREWRIRPLRFEIILAENGSQDRTVAIAQEICLANAALKLVSTGSPNYGQALRAGILAARGEFVVCEEIDLCDTDFHEQALHILRTTRADLVVGSKLIAGATDRRPFARNVASRLYTSALRVLLGFHPRSEGFPPRFPSPHPRALRRGQGCLC